MSDGHSVENPERLRQRQAHVCSTPMPLGFQAREIILKEACNLDQVDSYIRDHRPLWHKDSHAWKIFVNTCLGEYAHHSHTHSYYAKSIWIQNRHDCPIETSCL